jgi:hypothetical protein
MNNKEHEDLISESFEVSVEIDAKGFCVNFDTKFHMKKEHVPYVLLHFVKAFCAEHKLSLDVDFIPMDKLSRTMPWGNS